VLRVETVEDVDVKDNGRVGEVFFSLTVLVFVTDAVDANELSDDIVIGMRLCVS
jgi:hypothetical protein